MSAERRLNITHRTIFGRYWGSILGTLGLMLASSALVLLVPFALGVAINGLSEGTWQGVLFLASVQIGMLIFMLLRRFYDTRVYARIYREIGEEAVTASQNADVELTRITARANMLREVVDFFEVTLPWTLRGTVNLFGSLALLAYLSFTVFLAGLAAIGTVVIISLIFTAIVLRINAKINDKLEDEVDVFDARDPDQTREHFKILAGFQIRKSDLDVIMFALTNAPLVILTMFALYQVVLVEQAEIGTIFSVVSYVNQLQFAMFILPSAYQQLLRTMEITGRINRIGAAATNDTTKTADGDGPEREDSDPLTVKGARDQMEASLLHRFAANAQKRARMGWF